MKKAIDEFLEKCKHYGGSEARKKLLKNKYWKDLWKLGKKEEVNDEILCCARDTFNSFRKAAEEAISGLPFQKALEEVKRIMDSASRVNKEREVLDAKSWATFFFEVKVTPETVEEFLKSSLEQFVSPTEILKKMNEMKASAEIRKMIIDKYENKIDFQKLPVFGKESVFAGCEDQERGEKETVSRILTFLTSHGRLYCKHSSYNMWGRYEYEAVDYFPLRDAIKVFEEAVENDVIPDDWEEKLKTLGNACYDIDPYYSGSLHRELKERVANLEAAIEQKLGKLPKGITGKGLEFVSTEGGAKKVYLNGELIVTVANAQFGEKATNGKVVAWKVTERIDHCNILGDQIRQTVYYWKPGMNRPSSIYEDHAYAAERSFSVDAPEVTPSGQIKIKGTSEGKEYQKVITV